MIKRLNIARTPASAAVVSGVLMLAALTGVIFAATSASGSSTTTSAPSFAAAPLNQGAVALPKPCHVAKNQQTCDTAASKPRRAKQVKKQPAQPAALPLPTVAPRPTSP
jgi:hypothetical protein